MNATVVPSPFPDMFPKKLLHLLLCSAALPESSQPSYSLLWSESSRAVERVQNFPVQCPASSRDGCRKALHHCSLSYSNWSNFLHFLHLRGLHVKPQHKDATKLVKSKETRAKFCISEGRCLHFPVCTKQCTKENRCLGQKQRQETHRYSVAL